MRAIFLVILLILSLNVFCQIGINTESPTESLDINGTFRVREGIVLEDNTEPWLLVSSEDGVVKKLPANTFSVVMQDVVINTRFNDTVRVSIPSGYENFQLDISCENPCNRWIYASLRYVGRETILLDAAARGMSLGADATLTTVGIPSDGVSWGASFHVFWNRNKVIGCANYGSIGNQGTSTSTTASYLYDFWIRRTASNVVSFIWGAINDPSQITEHTAIESATLKWNFIFTKL